MCRTASTSMPSAQAQTCVGCNRRPSSSCAACLASTVSFVSWVMAGSVDDARVASGVPFDRGVITARHDSCSYCKSRSDPGSGLRAVPPDTAQSAGPRSAGCICGRASLCTTPATGVHRRTRVSQQQQKPKFHRPRRTRYGRRPSRLASSHVSQHARPGATHRPCMYCTYTEYSLRYGAVHGARRTHTCSGHSPGAVQYSARFSHFRLQYCTVHRSHSQHTGHSYCVPYQSTG